MAISMVAVVRVLPRGSSPCSIEANRHLQTPVERQCHRSEALRRVIDKGEVVAVFAPINLGIIANDDRSLSQMGSDEFECRSRHRQPDIEEHESNRPLDLTKGL